MTQQGQGHGGLVGPSKKGSGRTSANMRKDWCEYSEITSSSDAPALSWQLA